MRKLVVILAGAVVLLLGYKLLFKADRMDKFPVDKAFTVDFTFPNLAREEFTDREKADQARDWLLYTVLANSGLKRKDVAEATFDLAPVRYGFNSTLASFDYGDTRSKFIGNGEVVALIPASDDKTRLDHLAYVLDDIRKNQGEIPQKAYVFEYELNTEDDFARITRREDVDAGEFYTEAMGYFETAIGGLEDFKAFMDKTDDVTYARQDGEALVLGGRKLQSRAYGRATVEDVAAIWQSEEYIKEKQAEQDTVTSLDAEYTQRRQEVIAEYYAKLQSLTFDDGSSVASLPEHDQKNLTKYIADVLRGEVVLDAYASRYRSDRNVANLITAWKAAFAAIDEEFVEKEKAQESGKVASASGFSLDPSVNFKEAISFVKTYAEFFDGELQPRFTADDVIKSLEQRNGDLFQHAVAKVERSFLGDLLDLGDKARNSCSYQKARYDGLLQGTAVGMTLFYTDLMAKIWAGNRFESKPIDYIVGFKDHEQSYLSATKVFDLESQSLPAVRLWFGPNKNGFQAGVGKTELAFARNATQIFALSNDPGDNDGISAKGQNKHVEKQASAEFDVALSWWNNHYEEVGRYEPQYERLNEIMKWSTIITWLDGQGMGTTLDFLAGYPVKRDLWFPDWVNANQELKFKDWKKVSFFSRGSLGDSTEALPILLSPNKIISGGVTLAEKRLIAEAPEIIAAEKNLIRRANIAEDIEGGENAYKTFKETKFRLVDDVEAKAVNVKLQPKEGYKLRNRYGEVKNAQFDWTIVEDGRGNFTFRAALEDVPIGELQSVKVAENGFTTGFRAYEMDKGLAIAKQVSEYPGSPEAFFGNHPDVAKWARAGSGEWYVQLKNSDRWTVMNIDAEPSVNLAQGWQARTSGSRAEASLIDLKWVSKEEAGRAVDMNKAFKNSDLPPIRQTVEKCLADVEKLGNAGKFDDAIAQTEKLIQHFGETPELVRLEMRYRLKAALQALEESDVAAACSRMNDVVTKRPFKAGPDYFREMDNTIRSARVSREAQAKFKNLADMYYTDGHVFASGSWEGYRAVAKEVPLMEAAAKKGAKFIYSEQAARHIDPTMLYEEVIGQIRSIPGVRVYDISAEAIGRNTRLYATVEPTIDAARGITPQVRLRVHPGSAIRSARGAANNCKDEDEDGRCDNEYTVKGPVYYVSTSNQELPTLTLNTPK